MKKTDWNDFWNIDRSSIVQPGYAAYEISIDTFFNARHYVVLNNIHGDEHSHSYRIQVRCCSSSLDHQQMIMGFADLRKTIHSVTQIYNNSLLNSLPPFQDLQATTEALAAVMFQQLSRLLVKDNLELLAVTIWESPDEGVTFERRQR